MRCALLGEIHQVEVHGEGRGGGPRGVDGERGHLGGQASGGRRLARAPRLGEGANALLGLEEIGGFLGAEHVAQRLAEQVDGGREIHAIEPSSVPATRCPVSAVRAGASGGIPLPATMQERSSGGTMVSACPRRSQDGRLSLTRSWSIWEVRQNSPGHPLHGPGESVSIGSFLREDDVPNYVDHKGESQDAHR